MIGVIADPAEVPAVEEFFELFKTRWELYRSGRSYEVILTSQPGADVLGERLTVRYGGRPWKSEELRHGILQPADPRGRPVNHEGDTLPLYGNNFQWGPRRAARLVKAECRHGRTIARVGYDLFWEIRWLLTRGQPPEHAAIPTLELHIDLLRRLIRDSGATCPEFRPVPEGYRFIAVLTHDVDHPSLRLHRFDRTVLGFLYRALLGSLVKVVRGQEGGGYLLRNWVAALKLPLVQVGLARDFWRDFPAYVRLERGWPSTFFVLPFANRPGRRGAGLAPRIRGAAYGARDVAPELQTLQEAGCEIGLHGIDAWCEEAAARGEIEELAGLTTSFGGGVRMHWLYFDEGSPLVLERAGAVYDSTVGYNNTVGYRAGTGQVYRPLGATRLLELPLIIMDTALFYPSHLNLSRAEAWNRVKAILDCAERVGGCVTVNWHDRSLAPERQWGGFYRELVEELERCGAWITTAGEAVNWFRARRAAFTGELAVRDWMECAGPSQK
jgi:hypothetical protein